MRNFSLSLLALLVAVSVSAEPVSAIKLNGKILSFDARIVTLDQNGKKLVVPRTSIAASKLAAGDSVEAALTPEQYEAVKKESLARPKKTK